MVLSSYRHEVLSYVLHLASYFHCCFQNRLTEMPAECRGREGKVAVQKASLLGKAYAAVCNIYCFVKT